jgi:hypothetical protein
VEARRIRKKCPISVANAKYIGTPSAAHRRDKTLERRQNCPRTITKGRFFGDFPQVLPARPAARQARMPAAVRQTPLPKNSSAISGAYRD